VRLLFVCLVAISLAACGGMPNSGTPLQAAAVMPAPQPPGVSGYCAQPPETAAQPFWDALCNGNAVPTTVALTPDRWSELQSIQTAVDGFDHLCSLGLLGSAVFGRRLQDVCGADCAGLARSRLAGRRSAGGDSFR